MSNKEKLLASAQKNLEKGQYIKAIKDFEEVVALEPKVAGHRQKLADAMVRAQMPAGAVPHYEFVATSLSEAGFYLKAIAIYKQIQKIEPERFDIFLRLAELNEKQGLAGNASAEYKNLAALYEKKGMTTEAVNILQKVADLEPGNILHKVRIAESYTKGGFKEKGREEFERLAADLEAHKSFDQLLKVYEFFVKLFPGDRSAQAGFARTLVLRGDAEKGMQLLKGLIKQSPDDADVLNALATGYQALGDFENEHLTLQHMLKKRPEDLDDRERLIRSFLAGGDFPRGMEELQKWGGKLLQSGRKDAVHAFCRHLQEELPGDDARVAQLLGSLGITPASAGAASAAPLASVSVEENSFDLGLDLGGVSVVHPPSVSAEENISLPGGLAGLPSGAVDVSDTISVPLPTGGKQGVPAPALAPAIPASFGAEESPLDFLEGFGDFSGATMETVASIPAEVVPAPKIVSPAPVSAPAEVTPAEVAVDEPEMEFELDLGGGVEVAESVTLSDPDSVTELSAPPAETTPEFLDASTEISFPDDFTLDLSAEEVAAGTPEPAPEMVEMPADAANFIASREIDLSLTDDATLIPEFDLDLGSGSPDIGVSEDVAAEIEEVEILEELEELDQLEELDHLEELEELEEIEEAEPLILGDTDAGNISPALVADTAEDLEADIDISGYSLDGVEEISPDSGGDFGSQLPDTSDSGLPDFDLALSPDVAEVAAEAPAATAVAPKVEIEAVSPVEDGDEELGEFCLAAVSVDEPLPLLDIGETRFVELSPAPLSSFEEMTAELEEVGFYLNQGLFTEAEQICRRLLEIDPDFSPALEKLEEVESRRRSAAPAEETAGEDFLDLAAEILDDGALRATENLSGVEDLDRFRFDGVFSEFKKGIESQIDSGDTESHYNLGIAYKEMGLLDDAIAEFAKAMSNPARRVDCLTLQGICLAEKGAFAQAEALFTSGIDNRDLSEIERISLHYEMGLLYESWQRPADALSSFSTVAASDTVFRDVTNKITELRNRLESAGESPAAETKPAKNRVSYV